MKTCVKKYRWCVFLILICPLDVFPQWSTSTLPESALFVCPGFWSHAVTFDDGSSIVAGTYSTAIYLQKLDPSGRKTWQSPTVALWNDSSNLGGGAETRTDGDGGTIISWIDERGAYSDQYFYYNSALYAQRIDKFGTVLWDSGGVLVSPLQAGNKLGDFIPDGIGGVFFGLIEVGYHYPSAPNVSLLHMYRYNANGQKILDRIIDTVNSRWINFQSFNRVDKYLYFEYYLDSTSTYITRIVDSSGNSPNDSIWYGHHSYLSWRDSILYSFSDSGTNLRMDKIGPDGILISSLNFNMTLSNCTSPYRKNYIIPDFQGGAYCLFGCDDSIYHITNSGEILRPVFPGIYELGGYCFPDGCGGLVISSDFGVAQRWDSTGKPLWGDSLVYQNQPDTTYEEDYYGDNNGGIITTFWTTWGGIYAEHTGRNGRVGIITSVHNEHALPTSFKLLQNYPNPFNPSTSIRFILPERSRIKLILYDILGRNVATLIDKDMQPGIHTFIYKPHVLSSGTYYITMYSDRSPPQTKKILLMR